jgi:hypothetical protein
VGVSASARVSILACQRIGVHAPELVRESLLVKIQTQSLAHSATRLDSDPGVDGVF